MLTGSVSKEASSPSPSRLMASSSQDGHISDSSSATIVQYWHSQDVPSYITELLQTFTELNPDLQHLVFDESSAASFIDEHFGPRQLRAFRACAVPAMQADYFRYCAIHALGGVYCDADVRCVAALCSLVPQKKQGRLFLRPEGNSLINGIFAFGSPGHPFLALVLEIVTANIERRLADRVYFNTGPPILTSLLWLNRLGSRDAFLELAEKHNHLKYAHCYLDAVGDLAQVGRAFDGIEFLAAKENRWTGNPQTPLPYKATDAHFTNVRGRNKIFRD